MERIKLTFMDCNYAVHKDCGVVVATAKFKIFGEVLTIKGKSMCPPSMFDVNIGKKIAIGGNITDTTQANVVYIPSTIKAEIKSGAFIKDKNHMSQSFIISKRDASHILG